MIRYRDGMTEEEMRNFLSSAQELDEAYARAVYESPLVMEEDEASAEEAEYYDQLRKEFGR